ncbi:hypothetical protein E3U43_004048 [Larimichthys crocea]|uniref:Uncharacterized protein n=1 Tax=Larimichthys crocea TaxID=215358 RepID=A0ACD3RK43_LARCR|nr:hypothetical protein E3U43_004048 [Larimichthys crocea]
MMRTVMAPMKTALFVFVHWVLQFAVCRDVTLPVGPLYRVAGFPPLPALVLCQRTTAHVRKSLSGSCTGKILVGGRWEWCPPGIRASPMPPFQPRVRNGEVRVERDSGDKVRLVIQRLRAEDQGKFRVLHTQHG